MMILGKFRKGKRYLAFFMGLVMTYKHLLYHYLSSLSILKELR
jgi:hypothetical protein